MTFRGRGFARCDPVDDNRGVFGGGLFFPQPCEPETVGGVPIHNHFSAAADDAGGDDDGAAAAAAPFDAIVLRAT